MQKLFVGSRLSILASLLLVFSCLIPVAQNSASAVPALVTCVNFQTGNERISHNGKCRITQEAQANWHLNPSDSPISSGANAKVIGICSNKETSPVTYQVIRNKCARHQISTMYSRSGSLPSQPIITGAGSYSHDSASLKLAVDPSENSDAPIAFYTVSSSKGDVLRINSWKDLSITVSGLRSSTSYTFTITATNVDGTSPVSISSLPITTQVYVAPVSVASTPTLAAPAFALSAIAETRTVNTAATGFTISSTGGTIVSFGISAIPAGMSFSTSTGALTGTPTSIQSATSYTITATNASGTATKTFTLTVSAAVYTVGSNGPGGGKVFYVSNMPFTCGPTLNLTCKYLEAAPSLWNGGTEDPLRTWAQSGQGGSPRYDTGTVNNAMSPETASAIAIGWGYRNTLAIILQGSTNTANSAAALADAYSVSVDGVVFDDWFLPSKGELFELVTQRASVGGITGPNWSSSEYNATNAWWVYYMVPFGVFPSGDGKNNQYYVRPIRAF